LRISEEAENAIPKVSCLIWHLLDGCALRTCQRVVVGFGVGPTYFGPPPVCEYGYYGYAPYACAPYGYYGPSYFSGGVFIGAGPCSTASTAAQVSMAALSFTVAATSTIEDMATSDADAIGMDSAAAMNGAIAKEETSVVGTIAAVTREETSTAAVASMAEAVPAVADAGKFRFLAGSERAHTSAK